MTRKREVLTEATGKRWKLLQVIAVPAVLVGWITLLYGIFGEAPGAIQPGLMILLPGLACWALARFGAWWYHG